MTYWIGYAKGGKEVEVCEEIEALGIPAFCARKVEMLRKGKNRLAEPVISPVLPNYVFIETDVENWFTLQQVKNLATTKIVCPSASIPGVKMFLHRCSVEFDRMSAKIEAGERLDQFSEGDALEIVSGALGGLMARFRHIVEEDFASQFPVIVADVEFMGQTVTTRLDPLDVKAAE